MSNPSAPLLYWDTADGARPKILSATKAAPSSGVFVSPETGNFVFFDGYLFDQEVLRRDLGVSRQYGGAALVASGYERWGTSVFDRLRGGYCVAVWDESERQLHVARDETGLNSCFYWWNGRVLLVSPALDSVLAHPEVDARFNRVVIAEYLQGALSPRQREETFYEDIHRLAAAHRFSLTGGGLTVHRYWDPLPPGFTWATDEELAEFPTFFERAVQRCLAAGTDSLALSGGFDSVAIAALAKGRRANQGPLHAISLRFANTVCDEGNTQTEVARALGMPLLIQALEESLNGEHLVPSTLGLSGDSPSPVLSMWQFMYSGLLRGGAARGLSRLLMGTGGDDVLTVDFGYGADCVQRGDVAGLWRFNRSWQKASPFSKWHVSRVVVWDGAIKPELRRLAARLIRHAIPGGQGWLLRRRTKLQPWISRADRQLVTALQDRRLNSDGIASERAGAYVRAMRKLPLAPLLLMELDQGQAWARQLGFTLLYPYFDRDLMEFLLRAHPEHLIAGGVSKAKLRRLVADRLPDVMMRSKKVDFSEIADAVLRSEGPLSRERLGGLTILSDLNIVDGKRLEAEVDSYFRGENKHRSLVWRVISTEAWLQRRSTLLSKSA